MSKPTKEIKMFNNQYLVKKKISSGSFGVVFLGIDKLSGLEVAMKIEKEDNEETRSLDREVEKLYKSLSFYLIYFFLLNTIFFCFQFYSLSLFNEKFFRHIF